MKVGLRRHVKPEIKIYAKKLRRNQTLAEELLWKELRKKKMGLRFRRQAIIRGWIVDFYCPSAKLIIEVDGGYHKGRFKEDVYRDEKISDLGFHILRLKNEAIYKNLSKVIEEIKEFNRLF